MHGMLDAVFAVVATQGFKSHTEATLTLNDSVTSLVSTKQKVNTQNSTDAELIGVDDVIPKAF